MKKLIPILGIFFLLTSCYSNPKDKEKIKELENRVLSLEKQVTSNNIDNKIKCLDLWEKSKERIYGEEIANYKVKYHTELETCIVGNIYDQKVNTGVGDKYFISVYDLINNDFLLFYLTYGEEVEYDGMNWTQAIEKYESFGLKV